LIDFSNEKEETDQQTESHAYQEFQLVLEQEKLQQKGYQVEQKENPELDHQHYKRSSIHLVDQAADCCEPLNQMMIFLYGLVQDVT
jgi:hypothetical protein